MIGYTRQTIDYQSLPEKFSLHISDVDAVNVNFLKEMYRKVMPTHSVTSRVICQPNDSQLYPSQLIIFLRKSVRRIRRDSGKSTDT